MFKKERLFTTFTKGCLVVLFIMSVACNNDDDFISTPPEETVLSDFWLVEEKGWIFKFSEGENDIFYNFNAAGCAIQDNNFVPAEYFGFTLNEIDENTIIGTSDLSDSEVIFKRMVDENLDCLPDQISATEDAKVNFDHFWNIFNDYYAFFEERNIDWSQFESLGDQVTEDNLYETIEALTYLLEDGHVSIYDPEQGVDIDSGIVKLLERLNANLSGDYFIESEEDYYQLENLKGVTILDEYLEGNFEIDDNGTIFWGLIGEDVGYINIISMEGYGTTFNDELMALNTLLDTIMIDLQASGVSKLIIDIRFNNGGYDTAALDIVSRFMDQERVSYFKKARLGDGYTENKAFMVGPKGNFQFTEDIVLLTSPFTISAGELFALCVKDLPYVTVVGENTNGAFSTILEHVLPNGAEIGLSNEVYTDAQGQVFEIVGVGPETQENSIPFLINSDFEQGIDSGIERALELLND